MPGQESKKVVLWAHLLPVNLRGGPLAREQYQEEIQSLQQMQEAQNVKPRGNFKHPVSQQGVSFAYGGYATPIGGYTGHSKDGKVRPDKVANIKKYKDHEGEYYLNEPTVNLLGGVEGVERVVAQAAQEALNAPIPIQNQAGQNGGTMPSPENQGQPQFRLGGQIGGQIPPVMPSIQGKIPDGNYNRGFDGKVRTIEGSYVVGGEVWNQAPHESGEGPVNPVDQFDYKVGMEKYGPGVYPITSYQLGGFVHGKTMTRQGYQFGGFLPIGGDHDQQRKPIDPLEAGYQLGGNVFSNLADTTWNSPKDAVSKISQTETNIQDPTKFGLVESGAGKPWLSSQNMLSATNQSISTDPFGPPGAADPTQVQTQDPAEEPYRGAQFVQQAAPPPIQQVQQKLDPGKEIKPLVVSPITIEPDESFKAPSNLYKDFGLQSLMDIGQGNSEYYENIINRTMQDHAGNAAAGEAALRQQLAQGGITGPAADALLRSYARNVRVEGDVLRGDLAGKVLGEARQAAGLLVTAGMADLKFEQGIKEFDQAHALLVRRQDNFENTEKLGILIEAGNNWDKVAEFMETNFDLEGVDLSHLEKGENAINYANMQTAFGNNVSNLSSTGQKDMILLDNPVIRKDLENMWDALGFEGYDTKEFKDFAKRQIQAGIAKNDPLYTFWDDMSDGEIEKTMPAGFHYKGDSTAEGWRQAHRDLLAVRALTTDEDGNLDMESHPAWKSITGQNITITQVGLDPNKTYTPGTKYTDEGTGLDFTVDKDGNQIDWEPVMDLPGYAEAKGVKGAVLIDKENDTVYTNDGTDSFKSESLSGLVDAYKESEEGVFGSAANKYFDIVLGGNYDSPEGKDFLKKRTDEIISTNDYNKLKELGKGERLYQNVYGTIPLWNNSGLFKWDVGSKWNPERKNNSQVTFNADPPAIGSIIRFDGELVRVTTIGTAYETGIGGDEYSYILVENMDGVTKQIIPDRRDKGDYIGVGGSLINPYYGERKN